MMKRISSLLLASAMMIVLAFMTGCASLLAVLFRPPDTVTERHILPTISGASRVDFDLNPPILCAVYDGRVALGLAGVHPAQKPEDAAIQLQADLSRIYGTSIEWIDYVDRTPPDRVAVRIRLVTLGFLFGSRMISSTSFTNAVGSAQVNATGPWGPVAGTVSSQQSIYSSSFTGEGWWNGAAWIDLEVQDYRGGAPISFTMPIASERREPNFLGYPDGDKAARIAWDKVAVQLTRALDTIIRTLRDEQP